MKTVKSIERQKWDKIEQFFIENFTDGERPDVDTILFLIGVQELGQGNRKFEKDDKVNLIHIAVCTVLKRLGSIVLTAEMQTAGHSLNFLIRCPNSNQTNSRC